MRIDSLLNRIARPGAAVLLLCSLQACGSSATSVTSPTNLTRCGIAMQPIEGPLPAAGGSAVINVSAARECAWSATVEGAWLSVRAGASGQGDGTVELAAAPNPDPAMRRGAVVANGQRTEISQAAGECELSLSESSASFTQAGGNGQVQVRASSTLCSWTASSDEEWLRLRNTSGQGNGSVAFEVPASTAPPRSGTITISGQKFSVTQSEGCTFAITPASMSASPAGANGAVTIATSPACPWTAASNVTWIQVSPASGIGPAPVAVTVAATGGKSRTGTALIAGQPFTVTQAQGCSYAVQPLTASIGASGGTVTVALTANGECDWTATSNDSWITIQGRTSGSGDATLTLNVAATAGPSRSGSVTVGGQRVTVSQTQGCSFSISPENASAPSSSSTGKVSVTTAAGCNWTASSSASWLTISSGGSGSGNGDVNYAVAATNGPGRSATLTVAGKTFTLNQGDGCSVTLSPPGQTMAAAGGTGTVNVTSAAGCTWSTTSDAPWLTVTSGASGTGNGSVGFSATANGGPSRSGKLTIGGQQFTVDQAEACTFSITPENVTLGASAGSTSVGVTTTAGCAWSATPNAPWITVASGASGNGNGTVQLNVEANTGGNRSGTATIAGRTFSINQTSGCTFVVAPETLAAAAAGGPAHVDITAAASCGWTAASAAAWITITSPPGGTGNGGVDMAIAANDGPARSGTVQIAGRTVTINQDSGCTIALGSTSETVVAGGGSGTIAVTTTAACTWAATSNAPWITITTGSPGTGPGSVQYSVAANATGAPRSGTIAIGNAVFTVNQQ